MGPGADTLSHLRGNSLGSDTEPAPWESLSIGPVGNKEMADRGQELPGQRGSE